jgi:hypothetical protein
MFSAHRNWVAPWRNGFLNTAVLWLAAVLWLCILRRPLRHSSKSGYKITQIPSPFPARTLGFCYTLFACRFSVRNGLAHFSGMRLPISPRNNCSGSHLHFFVWRPSVPGTKDGTPPPATSVVRGPRRMDDRNDQMQQIVGAHLGPENIRPYNLL